jgi:hypothetical protein
VKIVTHSPNKNITAARNESKPLHKSEHIKPGGANGLLNVKANAIGEGRSKFAAGLFVKNNSKTRSSHKTLAGKKKSKVCPQLGHFCQASIVSELGGVPWLAARTEIRLAALEYGRTRREPL